MSIVYLDEVLLRTLVVAVVVALMETTTGPDRVSARGFWILSAPFSIPYISAP